MNRWSFFEMKGDLDAMRYKGNYDLWYANSNGRLEDELKPIIDDTQAMDMVRVGVVVGQVNLYLCHVPFQLEQVLALPSTEPVEEGKTSKEDEEDEEEEEESSEGEDAQSSNNEEAAEEGDKEEEVHNEEGCHNVYGSEDSDSESVEDSATSITFGDSEEEDISKGFDIQAEQRNVFEIKTQSENQAVSLNASTSKARGLSDEEYESEELMSEDSDEDEDDDHIVQKQVFPRFKPIKDMADYKFDLRTIFGSKIEFIDAVKTHAMHNGKSTKFIKNDNQRVRVICIGGTKVRPCLWKLTTMKLSGEETWQLRVCHNTHTCSRDTVVKLMSADWLARKFESKLRSNPKTKIKELVDMAKRKWSQTLKKRKASRAKKIALKKIHGSNTEQFKRLFHHKFICCLTSNSQLYLGSKYVCCGILLVAMSPPLRTPLHLLQRSFLLQQAQLKVMPKLVPTEKEHDTDTN
ncbi:hypothetical protein G2W53_003495 [Senna tora]|uniref:Transposase MuDR plant domain-containing protein n=1 Tax=Senna tora TaxID=362788 RepID=A0A834XAW4_9FABA|nr:hypothetical protein G2W53_003495 [Senna tora]